MWSFVTFIFLFLCLFSCECSPTLTWWELKDVEENKNLNKTVLMVFTKPEGCSACDKSKEVFQSFTDMVDGLCNVVFVADSQVDDLFKVKKHPSVKFVSFSSPKNVVLDYKDSKYDDKKLSTFLTDSIVKVIAKRRGEPEIPPMAIVTDKNYKDLLLKDIDRPWFVKVYAPWCGHCKAMVGIWDQLSKELSGKVQIAKIDGTTESDLASKLNVRGFPTLLMFPSATKTRSLTDGIPYQSNRDFEALKSFALGYYQPISKPTQLLTEAQFVEKCGKGVCIIVFLPHILDSSVKERTANLKVYETIAKAASGLPYTFLWSQGGDQIKLEEQLNLGFGYPAVIATNLEKGIYTIHKGNFTQESMRKFLSMQGAPFNLPNNRVPVVTVEKPWTASSTSNGKDEL